MESLRPRHWPALMLALACAAGAVYHGIAVLKDYRFEQALARVGQLAIDEDTDPRLVFAKARQLGQSGDFAEAARLYTSLRNTADRALRAAALHNLGTLYLDDAARRWNARGVLEYARVSSEVELAKESLREALRLNPEDWDARYNLEYAFRITPPPKEKDKSDWKGTKSSVFSTLPGLPGGGP